MSAIPLSVSPAPASLPLLCVHDAMSPQRDVLEEYVHTRYADTYQARVSHFLPFLLATWNEALPQGVLGLRPGACGRFFVENYLDHPIEEVISECNGAPVSRDQIIETGNLAGSRGSSQLLFIVLTEVLHRAGFRWVTFTATAQVTALLNRLGFAPRQICEADPTRLGEESEDWGSYYDNHPWVVIGDVEQAYQTLKGNQLAQKMLAEQEATISMVVAQLQQHNLECAYE